MSVWVLATLDTKGHEAAFVRDELVRLGVAAQLIDTGCIGEPIVPADISREQVFAAAGTNLTTVQAAGDRGAAVQLAAQGVAQLARVAHSNSTLQGVMGLGGSAGTTIGTAAMRALPLAIPKLMVSTLASGQVSPFVGQSNICMLHAVVDIAGLNRISRLILAQAAHAMAGMVQHANSGPAVNSDRPVIVASMFGVTTPCVDHARKILEQAGYEVLVFHATGNGGRTLEALVRDGLVAGVLDVTTTELADELVGGILSAGPDRLTAAGQLGIPQVISVGALDMVNFGARDTVPQQFSARKFYQHNAAVTLMRTTLEENAQLGAEIGKKANSARGPTAILLPRQGVSAIDRAGQPFDDPAARQALFESIQTHAGSTEVTCLDAHINDSSFAAALADRLLKMLRAPHHEIARNGFSS